MLEQDGINSLWPAPPCKYNLTLEEIQESTIKGQGGVRGDVGPKNNCLGFSSNSSCIQPRHRRSLACVDESYRSTAYKRAQWRPHEEPGHLVLCPTAMAPAGRVTPLTFLVSALFSSGNSLRSWLLSDCILCFANVEFGVVAICLCFTVFKVFNSIFSVCAWACMLLHTLQRSKDNLLILRGSRDWSQLPGSSMALWAIPQTLARYLYEQVKSLTLRNVLMCTLRTVLLPVLSQEYRSPLLLMPEL